MEAYSSTNHYGSMPDPYSRTQSSRRQPILLIEDSEEEVQRESYKVNWKIAIPLLILGVVPGLIYLAGVAIANCLGGKEVRVQRHDPMESQRYGTGRTYQQYQHVVRGETPRSSLLDTNSRQDQRTRAQKRDVRSRETDRGQTYHSRKAKKDKSGSHRSKRREESPTVVDRTENQRPTTSAIPSQRHVGRKAKPSTRDIGRSAARETTPLRTATSVVDHSVPAPIREGREPRGRDEEVAVNVYMGTRVIQMSKMENESERPERIAAMKRMAKALPYSKAALPGTFQGFLATMYNNSYKALYS